MKVRSITSFYDPACPQAERQLKRLAEVSEALREAIQQKLEVQSTRLGTSPFSCYLNDRPPAEVISCATQLEQKAQSLGWQYLTMGPALPEHPWAYKLIPQLIRSTKNVFFSAVITANHTLYPGAVLAGAQIIHQTAQNSTDGFANLRFAALASVEPWTPFLPAAYHQVGSAPAISIAVECADAVNDAFSQDLTLEECRQSLLDSLQNASSQLEEVILPIIHSGGIRFKGFDFSPAPFPEDWCSLAGAAERLGLAHIGGLGTLPAIALIADTLDRGNWRKAGFNGMMLPLLEDSILAKRAAEGQLNVKDLLLYSTHCGTGLDTIPLPGDTSIEQLRSVLMDIAAISIRLDKPLTARLMPIPGKSAGDFTDFHFPFFANSRVLSLEGQPLHRFFYIPRSHSHLPAAKISDTVSHQFPGGNSVCRNASRVGNNGMGVNVSVGVGVAVLVGVGVMVGVSVGVGVLVGVGVGTWRLSLSSFSACPFLVESMNRRSVTTPLLTLSRSQVSNFCGSAEVSPPGSTSVVHLCGSFPSPYSR